MSDPEVEVEGDSQEQPRGGGATTHASTLGNPRALPLNSKRLTGRLLQEIAKALGLPTNATHNELMQMIDGDLSERGREPLNVQVLLYPATFEEAEPQLLELQDDRGVFLEVDLTSVEPQSQTKEPPETKESEDDSGSEDSGPQDSVSEQFHYYKPSEAGEDSMPTELDAAMQALDEAKAQVEQLSAELEGKRSLVYSLEESLEAERARRLAAQQEAEELQATMVSPEEVSKLCGEFEREKVKVKEIWSLSCEQLRRMDDEYGKCVEESVKKDREISKLHRRISELENQVRGVSMPMVHAHTLLSPQSSSDSVLTGMSMSMSSPNVSSDIQHGVSAVHANVSSSPRVLSGSVSMLHAPTFLSPVLPRVPSMSDGPLSRRRELQSSITTSMSTTPSLVPSASRPVISPRAIPVTTLPVSPVSLVVGQSQVGLLESSVLSTPAVSMVSNSGTVPSCSQPVSLVSAPVVPQSVVPTPTVDPVTVRGVRKAGKAPPVDPFTSELPDVRFEDWLPTLERAAHWNGWSEEEKLMQLAGYLRGKALQEWNPLSKTEKATYESATCELGRRLDPGNRVMAVQDFRHAIQRESESVADYLRRLERCFQLAYGYDNLKLETRETMLYSQLQEGLLLSIVRSPSVSGCQTYKQLCISAKQEEKRLADIRRRQQFQQTTKVTYSRQPDSRKKQPEGGKTPPSTKQSDVNKRPRGVRACYNCGSTEHIQAECKVRSKESAGTQSRSFSGHTTTQTKPTARTKLIQTSSDVTDQESEDPVTYLYSSDEDSQVGLVRVPFEGSKPQKALVEVQGIPAMGIIDTGADITIMGPELFKTVAAATRMKKRCLKPVDKSAYTYDHKPIHLDGRLDLDISFAEKTLQTPVYIKMDATDQLLLSEGVCRQLAIISYHRSVQTSKPGSSTDKVPVRAPMVRVKLVKTTSVPSLSTVTAKAELVQGQILDGPILLEQAPELSKEGTGVQLSSSLVAPVKPGEELVVVLQNSTGFTQRLK